MTDRFSPSNNTASPCNNLGNYCGGTWKGITNHLDYIQGMGFDAIWISPVISNTPGGYHGYWAQDFSQLNANFGTEQELEELVSAVHSRNMLIMVGVRVI
jgi:alpha-amylase